MSTAENGPLLPGFIPCATPLSGGVFEKEVMVEGTIPYIFDRENGFGIGWPGPRATEVRPRLSLTYHSTCCYSAESVAT